MSKRTSILLTAMALATIGTTYADGGSSSEGALTITATVTTEGPETETAQGYTRNLVSSRLGNRQILQLMVDNELLDTITGYSLVQRFSGCGGSMGYYAVHTNGHSVEAPSDILGLDQDASLAGYNVRYRNELETGTTKIKAFSTLRLDGNSFSLMENITVTHGVRVPRQFGSGYYDAFSSKGKFAGTIDGDVIIEANLNTSRSKPFQQPV